MHMFMVLFDVLFLKIRSLFGVCVTWSGQIRATKPPVGHPQWWWKVRESRPKCPKHSGLGIIAIAMCPNITPPQKNDMSREQLWHWKMIISSWNGPFFGEMRSFSRGITPATSSSNDPLVRLNTSTPSKTNMTIEKQPWVKMYLLWKKKRWFSSDRHVS